MSSGAALVTGSTRGIGRGILLALARAGYDVAVHYRHSASDAEETRRAAEELGVRAISLSADVSKPDAAAGLVGQAAEELGSLDVLVNNVGNYVFKAVDELTFAEWDDVLATNLTATFATCQAVLPIMREQGRGRIVNIGYAGTQTLVARPSLVPYAIAKTGCGHPDEVDREGRGSKHHHRERRCTRRDRELGDAADGGNPVRPGRSYRRGSRDRVVSPLARRRLRDRTGHRRRRRLEPLSPVTMLKAPPRGTAPRRPAPRQPFQPVPRRTNRCPFIETAASDER